MNRLNSFICCLFLLCAVVLPQSVKANEQQDQQNFINHIKGCYNYYYNSVKPDAEFILPFELVVGVAIHESDWGRSRFAQEGYNYYGIRTSSKDPDEYMVPKYAPGVKVAKYIHNCNSTIAFIDLMTGSGHYREAMEMIKNNDKDNLPWLKILTSINVKYSVSENWPGKIAFIIKNLT